MYRESNIRVGRHTEVRQHPYKGAILPAMLPLSAISISLEDGGYSWGLVLFRVIFQAALLDDPVNEQAGINRTLLETVCD